MSELTHVNAAGEAHMVDVGHKDPGRRVATAAGRLDTTAEVVEKLRGNGLAKGDALATARVAGIMAAKRTWELVPLCHPIALSKITVEFELGEESVAVRAQVANNDRTGVEMEALTAVTVAALTLVDMVKAVDPAAEINGVGVVEKVGGKTGLWQRN
ncbi:cyclic pyranopterin monophosphate synthase MoaC [Salininema proteolyticum]|uniref:Cyclic pyranopterin monophosphate synthase n=1 Tax=Salininema proteolyticum TaxID=1607685 RepID=A0ABV8U4A6_9ACTN